MEGGREGALGRDRGREGSGVERKLLKGERDGREGGREKREGGRSVSLANGPCAGLIKSMPRHVM